MVNNLDQLRIKFLQLITFFAICFGLSLIVLALLIGRIDYFASNNSQVFSDYLPFYQQLFSNKTNELIYYLGGIIIFTITPIFLYILWKNIKYGLIFILLIVTVLYFSIIKQLVNFIRIIFFPYSKEIITLIIAALLLSLIVKYRYKLLSEFGSKLKIFCTHKIVKLLISLLIVSIIFLLVYNPKYKYSYTSLSFYGRETYQQFHHVNFFLAPINEVINGKTLLVNIVSQYGILMTYIPALIFSLIGISYSNFVLYNMIIVIIYCCLFYFFVKKITKSNLFGFIAVISFIKLALFRYDPTWESFTLPSTTPIRYFFDIIVVFLIYDFFNNQFSRTKLFLMSGIVVLNFFYSPEFGIPLLISYAACLSFDLLASLVIKKEKVNFVISRCLIYINSLLVNTIIIGGIISALTFIKSGEFPNWLEYFKYIIFYSKGFEDVAMQSFDLYYMPLFVYITSYFYILYRIYIKKIADLQLIIFLLVYGLLTFIYYINLSEPNHLSTVIHPVILLIFILLKQFKINLSKIKNYTHILFPVFLYFLIVLYPIYIQTYNLTQEIINRLYYRYLVPMNNFHYWSYYGTDFYLNDNTGKDFKKASDKIQQLTKISRDILILSRYDSLLYIMTKKTSLINQPIIEYNIQKISDANNLIRLILYKKPSYIFIYSEKYNQRQINIIEQIANVLKKHYSFVEHAGAVDVYKL